MNAPPPTQAFRLGIWTVDPAIDELSHDGHVVKLEPRMMRLLCYLAERPGKVVSPDELLDAVWAGLVVGQNSVYQAVAQLRRLLGDDSADPEYIATVPRKGYRLIAQVGEAQEPAAAATNASTPRTKYPLRWISLLALAGVLIVIASVVLWVWRDDQPEFVRERPAIAILPFTDLSSDKSNQVFCDGLADELLNALARVPELRITARTSAFMFRDRAVDVRDVGRKLGVTHIVEGSVRREGTHVRISAQLISVKDGFQVWASTFDRPYSDVLAIQENIAKDVVRALEVKLSPASHERLGQAVTPKVDAYELYLLGRFHQQQRRPESLARAIEYQRQALAIDPNFALAYAGFADAYMATYYYANHPLDDIAKNIEPAIEKALQIDPELGEAFAARGVLRTEQWNLDAAVTDLKRAIAVKPNYADAYVRLGAAYEYRAEPRLALASFDQAAALDPLHVLLHVRRCLTLQNIGEYAAASAACERAIVLQPDIPNALWARGLVSLAQGRTDLAISGYREAIARAPQRADLHAQLAWLYLDLDLADAARHSFDDAVAAAPDDAAWKLERARLFLTARDTTAFYKYVAAQDLSAVEDPYELLDGALLMLTAGDHAGARLLAERATHTPTFRPEKVLADVWDTRWGRSAALTLAQIALASGDQALADRYIADVHGWIDRVTRNGQVWNGAEYIRASELALKGDVDGAMAALGAARKLGWNRTWWMRNDPALKSLRARPDFIAMLHQIDEANAALRQKVLAL